MFLLLGLDQMLTGTHQSLWCKRKYSLWMIEKHVYSQELDRFSCFTSMTMELRAYRALACQLVHRVVETYCSARLDPIAEAGALFVLQWSYVQIN